MKSLSLILIVLSVLMFPTCNGYSSGLMCMICESSPDMEDRQCEMGETTTKNVMSCKEHYEKVKGEKAKPRTNYVCAHRIVRKSTVYGFIRERTCLSTEKDILKYCKTDDPDTEKYDHCSICGNDGCNKATRLIYPIITLISPIIILMNPL